jgi:hypothetical protein
MLENADIEKKLKDHDHKFKHLYETTDDLENRVMMLERQLLTLKLKQGQKKKP